MHPCPSLLLGLCALQTFFHGSGTRAVSAAVLSWGEEKSKLADKRQEGVNKLSAVVLGRMRIEKSDGYLQNGINYEERPENEPGRLYEGISSRATPFNPNKGIVLQIRSSQTKRILKPKKAVRRTRREDGPESSPESTTIPNAEPEPTAEPESTAEPEPTAEPKPEKNPNNSEPEPSAETSAEPNSNPELTSEPEPEPEDSWPEPAPEWARAYEKWQVAWPLHRYGFAAIFSLIGVVQMVEFARIHLQRDRKTPLKQSLMIMIMLFATLRSIVLFASPYGSTGTIPPMATRLLSAIGQPCIIAAVSLLLLVLIDTTKMNVAPPRFQKVTFIIPIITLHVVLVVVSDIIVAHFLQVKFLLLFCQLYFLITGLVLTLGYARVGWKISHNVASNVNQVGNRTQDSKMNKLQRLIFAFTATSAMFFVTTIYGAVGVFGTYSDVVYVEAWPWWGLQTAFRCLETAMCVLLLIMNINTTSRPSTRFRIFRNCLGRRRVEAWSRESTTQNATQSFFAPTTMDGAPKR